MPKKSKKSPKRKRKRTTQIERTAYHEAGHALATYVLKGRFRYVTIEPDEDSGGHILHTVTNIKLDPDENLLGDWANRKRLERAVLMSMSGGAAVYLLTGRYDCQGMSQDQDHAWAYVVKMASSMREAEAYMGWLTTRAEGLLQKWWHWKGVKALASELLKVRRVTYRRCEEIFKKTAKTWLE